MAQDRMQVGPARLESHHNFDDESDDAVKKEGPTFELGGETFHCVPMLPGYALTLLGRFVGTDERGKAVTSSDVTQFMEATICEELWIPVSSAAVLVEGNEQTAPVNDDGGVWEKCDDLDRWRALMADKRRPIHADKLSKIVLWLYGWYTERPTLQSAL